MRIRAEFPFVDEAVSVIIDMSDEAERDRSAYVTWEYPLCKTQLTRGSRTLDVGCLSLMELLGFLHLPLRRNEWPQFSQTEIGDCFLSLSVGSFTPEDGADLHRMNLRDQEGTGSELHIAFSEAQAEQWAVSVCEIGNRFMQLRQKP
jgi:hypothetical protein